MIAYGPQRNHLDTCYFGQLIGARRRDPALRRQPHRATAAGTTRRSPSTSARLPPEVTGLVFTVNSYSGQKFTEVAKAYCRLIDDATGEELVRFDLTNAEARTGVLMAKLIKQFSGEWEMTGLGEFVVARTVRGMVDAGSAAL